MPPRALESIFISLHIIFLQLAFSSAQHKKRRSFFQMLGVSATHRKKGVSSSDRVYEQKGASRPQIITFCDGVMNQRSKYIKPVPLIRKKGAPCCYTSSDIIDHQIRHRNIPLSVLTSFICRSYHV
jgi:hypothetical protein